MLKLILQISNLNMKLINVKINKIGRKYINILNLINKVIIFIILLIFIFSFLQFIFSFLQFISRLVCMQLNIQQQILNILSSHTTYIKIPFQNYIPMLFQKQYFQKLDLSKLRRQFIIHCDYHHLLFQLPLLQVELKQRFH